MAYAALVSLAQTIDQILNHDQYTISPQEKQQITLIHENITSLQAFLDDVVEKAERLEGRIADVANEAEDIIEHFMSEQIRARHGLVIESNIQPSKCKFMPCIRGTNRTMYNNQLLDLKKVIDEIESIAQATMEIKNTSNMEDSPLDDSWYPGSSSRTVTTAGDMVGFDDDLMEIKTRLCGESSKLQVIPIIGMGGIGKTTLARNAYDDQLMVQRFDIRVWVSVSHDYSPTRILSALLVSMKTFINQERSEDSNESKQQRFEEDNIESEEQISEDDNESQKRRQLDMSLMAEKVYKSLKGRRYLIVMDDVWSTKAWDDIRNMFPDDDNGSRIVLTTRLSDVASYPDPFTPLHEMHFMDTDRSWSLLQKKVFAGQDCPHELERIGKEIARNCRGLPLAIVVIGGILSTISRTRASWSEIMRNVSSAFATNNNGQFEKILSLSYTHLPHHLRPCFLYMGGFPEDYEIHVSKLVKLWVAEGFLKPPPDIGRKSLEEIAEEYLLDLIKRSLVLVTGTKSNGRIKSCSVHDLVRDLCIRKAQQESFFVQVVDKHVFLESVKYLRRVSTSYSNLRYRSSIVRTIMYFDQRSGSSIDSSLKFRLLRVLDVDNSYIYSEFVPLPNQLFELFHLRYLALDYPTKIPTTITNLKNLETLVIRPRKTLSRRSYYITNLPLDIWRMPKLRHIFCFYIGQLPDPEGSATCGLENLQTLSSLTNFVCVERIIKMIPNLKKLGLAFCTSDKPYEDIEHYCLENLVYLHQLEKLKFVVESDFPSPVKLHFPVFPMKLRKLTLSGWRLPWKDMTIVGSLPNLQVLKLRESACVGDTWETIEGEFLELNFLMIEESDLRNWITESSHFPNLKWLVIRRCRYLREIPDGIGEIATLELIEVEMRNKYLVESAKRIQEEQESLGNDALQVRFVQ
ncbi:hypothetical protein ABFS82_12G038800 [Erythranthe guttata]|uniref:Uncharacterized protein n=1 Tax=Erythranthe guttata TaxID=4155 RepID=A0A022Q3N0_ERYGU|nr:PREDICTED: putative late blight resistance protein homolog R1B-8 [Erythranthe guttata]EYU21105.1 hypothetical protein MIMGU_mgv1a021133mg [Erythranthe guttata]|eukprot:XP_012856941.1 PREDICTED: putative late blight resistance protein homolog R1B-8 [Erythranthe guttata]